MKKIGLIFIIICGVILTYLVWMAFTPSFIEIINTANTTSSVGRSEYFGAQSFLLALPWLFFFIPVIIGVAAIVIVLKKRQERGVNDVI